MTPKKIRDLVGGLLEDHKASQAPVPVERMAEKLSLVLRYVAFDDDNQELSGMLYQDKDISIIGVNSLNSSTRQRFTIAHEIGHFLLHKSDQIHIDSDFGIHLRAGLSSKGIDKREIEANAFAAELLMPEALISKELGNREIDFEEEEFLNELADKFNVSLQAMTFRLANLGLIKIL